MSYNIGVRKEDIQELQKKESLPTRTAKEFLQNTPVKVLFPDNRTKIITVDADDTVATAFKLLSENRILSLPVKDSKHNVFTGIIDMLDIVCHCLKDFSDSEIKGGGDFETLLQSHSSLEHYTCGQVAGSSGRNPYYPIEENASLMTAIQLLLERGAHRLPVIDSSGELVSLISLSHIVALIGKNISKFSAHSKTVGDLKLGYKEVKSINGKQLAVDAFKLIYEKKVLGVAVVDDNNSLIGNISASDLRQIGNSHVIARLLLPAEKFIELVPRSEDQLPGPYCVLPPATIEEVFAKIEVTRSHRLYVIDSSNAPIGVISLVDLLTVVMNNL